MKVFVILCVFAACMFAAGDPIPTVVPTPEQPSWNSGNEVAYDTYEALYGRKEEAPSEEDIEREDAHMHPPPPTSTEAPEEASEGEENENGIEEPEEVGEEVGEEPEEEDDAEEKEEKDEEEEEEKEEEDEKVAEK